MDWFETGSLMFRIAQLVFLFANLVSGYWSGTETVRRCAHVELLSNLVTAGTGASPSFMLEEVTNLVGFSANILANQRPNRRNDEGELETLALQLGGDSPLLVEGDTDARCWIIAKALSRHSLIFQRSVEHLVKTKFTGSEQVSF